MGPSTSLAFLALLWLSVVVGSESRLDIKSYSEPGYDCQCLPYRQSCNLEFFPLTVVDAYAHALYTCRLGTRLCCFHTQNQLDQDDPQSKVNSIGLLVKDPSSHLYRARQLRYDPGRWFKNDEPATTTTDAGIQLKEDQYKDEDGTGNMKENIEFNPQGEVEVKYQDTRKEQESVDTKNPILGQNHQLGNNLVMENIFQAIAEMDKASQVTTEENKAYVTVKQETFHMTVERGITHKAVKSATSQAVTGKGDSSLIAEDTFQTPAIERETTINSPLIGEEIYKLSGETYKKSKVKTEEKSLTALDSVHTTPITTEEHFSFHEANVDSLTVNPIGTMPPFHNELGKSTLGTTMLSMMNGNGTVLHIITTTEGLSHMDNTNKQTEVPKPFIYPSNSTLNLPKTNNKESMDNKSIAAELISQKNRKLVEFPSLPATEPEQLSIIHNVTDEAENNTEKYDIIHNHPNTEGLDSIYRVPVTKLFLEKVKKKFSPEKSHDLTTETKPVLLNQFGHTCSDCGNDSLASEPSIIMSPTKHHPLLVTENHVTLPYSSTPIRLLPTEHQETLSPHEESISTGEFPDSLQESGIYTTAGEGTGLETTPPTTIDTPVLWYWFFG